MSDCCQKDHTAYPAKHRCPVNGKLYPEVPLKTLRHHIRNPWNVELPNQGYYFCSDPDCAVVYFGEDDSTLNTSQLRTTVWQKQGRPDSTLCYCFGVSVQQAATPAIKDFVVQQTKQSLCACEIRNPSGRCCLKDFPKQ